MRALTTDEMRLVAGGYSEQQGDYNPGDIYVYGPGSGGGAFGDPYQPPQPGDDESGGGNDGGDDGGGDPFPDEDWVDVIPAFAPNAEQQALIEAFRGALPQVTQAINGLSDTARLTLPDGSVVTGAELKAVWAKADFVINPPGHVYANGTTRGESNPNGGNAIFSFNVDLLGRYGGLAGGFVYLALHELAHSTAAGVALNGTSYSEQFANDVARAIADAGGITTIDNPNGEPDGHGGFGSGYSTPNPLPFV